MATRARLHVDRRSVAVQYLRGVAALLVVFHHVRNPGNGLFDPIAHWQFGQAGVDLFFLISGYIMYSVARDQRAGDFLWRRVVRIVPLYWIATFFLYFQIAIGFPGVLPSAEVLVKSLLFVPHYHYHTAGEIWPFLIPGWTLNYEMFFYLIFAAGLAFRQVLPVVLLVGGGLIAGGQLIPFNVPNALLATYTSPIITEFFQGMLIALVHQRRSLAQWWALLPIGVMMLAVFGNLDAPRLLIWGLPMTLVLIGALAIEDGGALPSWPQLHRLGDASYSIYLTHGFAIQAALLIWWRVPFEGWLQFAIFTPVAVIGCAVAGVLVYHYVERPIQCWLTRSTQPSTAARPMSAAS